MLMMSKINPDLAAQHSRRDVIAKRKLRDSRNWRESQKIQKDEMFRPYLTTERGELVSMSPEKRAEVIRAMESN